MLNKNYLADLLTVNMSAVEAVESFLHAGAVWVLLPHTVQPGLSALYLNFTWSKNKLMLNKILSKVLGNKSGRDVKKLSPYVEQVNEVYETLHGLSNDQLRGKTIESMWKREYA